MRLPAATVQNLELFAVNSGERRERGSLFGLMANTTTAFGRRLLWRWLSAPLLEARKIEERLDAVEEIVNA
jgi:DNA mismatch repair protein MutS